MASVKHRASASDSEDIRPQNPLQSDFNADDTSNMDADERYLVRYIGS